MYLRVNKSLMFYWMVYDTEKNLKLFKFDLGNIEMFIIELFDHLTCVKKKDWLVINSNIWNHLTLTHTKLNCLKIERFDHLTVCKQISDV